MDTPLFATTRTGDPDTSHHAAASVGDVRESQRAVLRALAAKGPMTDEELITVYRLLIRTPPQSPSGIRTRRAELVRYGLVEWTGDTRTISTGRQARVWQAVL